MWGLSFETFNLYALYCLVWSSDYVSIYKNLGQSGARVHRVHHRDIINQSYTRVVSMITRKSIYSAAIYAQLCSICPIQQSVQKLGQFLMTFDSNIWMIHVGTNTNYMSLYLNNKWVYYNYLMLDVLECWLMALLCCCCLWVRKDRRKESPRLTTLLLFPWTMKCLNR